MNKLKLLVTASLLVGGGIFALSAADGVTSANAAELEKEITYDGKTATLVSSQDDIVSGDYLMGIVMKESFQGYVSNYDNNQRFKINTDISNAQTFSIDISNDNTGTIYYNGFDKTGYVYTTKDNLLLSNSLDDNHEYDWLFKYDTNNFIDISAPHVKNRQWLFNGSYFYIKNYASSNATDSNYGRIVLYKIKPESAETYFDSSITSTSLKLSGYSNGVFNENIVFNNIDFGDDKQTKYSPNEMVEAMGLDSSAWTISGTDVELLMYNGYNGEIQFYKDGYIEITNNESKINSFTLTGLTLSLSENLIVVDENNNEVKGTENGDGTTFTFSGDGTRKFKITLTGRDSLYATGSMQLYCRGSATITGAGIRFGTNIPVNLYDENADYGVIIAQASSLIDSLDSYLGLESDFTLDGFKHDLESMEVKYYDSGKLIPAYVMNINDTEAATPEEANYVQYALVLNGLENLLDEEFAAVCYMTSSDGTFHIMSEARHSVRSVAEAYLADDKIMSSLTNNSIALLNAVVA